MNINRISALITVILGLIALARYLTYFLIWIKNWFYPHQRYDKTIIIVFELSEQSVTYHDTMWVNQIIIIRFYPSSDFNDKDNVHS